MLSRRHVVIFLATGGYVGRMPMAPGTFGSLIGLPVAYALSKMSWPWAAAVVILLTALAVWSAGQAARQLGVKDPGSIVIDEIVGMAVTLLGLPFNIATVVAGFALFRIFDIAKPPPVRQLDRNIGGGWGIVLDDIAAGIMANIVLRAGLLIMS